MNSLNIDNIDNINQILVSVLFILSLINLIFGYKYIRGIIGAYGFVIAFTLVFSNVSIIIQDVRVSLFVAVISGLILFSVFYLLYVFSYFLTNIGVSYFLAKFLSGYMSADEQSIPYIIIILMIILAIVLFILSSKLKDKMNIIASSVIGSYGFLSSIYLISNNISVVDNDLKDLYNLIINNVNSGLWITLVIICSVFQYVVFIKWDKIKEKVKEKKENSNKDIVKNNNPKDNLNNNPRQNLVNQRENLNNEEEEKNKFLDSIKSGIGFASSKVKDVVDNINNNLENKMEENRQKRLEQMGLSQDTNYVGKVNLERNNKKNPSNQYDRTQMYNAGELQQTLAFNTVEMNAYKNMIGQKLNNNDNSEVAENKDSKVIIDNNCTYIEDYIKRFGNWEIDMILGKGTFGCVYRITRTELNRKFESALKVLTVPNKSQISEAESMFGNNNDKLEIYYKEIINEIANEIDLLYSLKGNTNIVSYEDHHIVKRDNEVVWDIMIRMEFLKSLSNFIKTNEIILYHVVQLGIDICTALEVCNNAGIVHRDIKIQNIFVSKSGNFKLGDFGISKKIEGTISSNTQKGTFMYMAPEIIKGENQDFTVDIYSLGIVLYKMLNYNRMPFLPTYPNEVSQEDVKKSINKRVSDANMDYPANCDNELGKIILKACYFNPKYRYRSPTSLKNDLQKYLSTLTFDKRSSIILNVKKLN
jgi:hypothetical protein